MKKIISLMLILLLVTLSACSNYDGYEKENNSLTTEEQIIVGQLTVVWDHLQPKPDAIAGTVEYWKDPAGDDFILYYTNANKLYYSTIKINDSTVTNHGLVLTENIINHIDDAPVVYIDGKIVAKEFGLAHITFKKFISSMNYSFEDVRNDAASEIANGLMGGITSTKNENIIKCDYLSRLIEYKLLSTPGSNYASIYDDATITDFNGNWYEIRFSAEVYQVMSRLTSKVTCYAWVYATFDIENEHIIDVHYESFDNAPYKYFYITYKLANEEFTNSEIAQCKNQISWGIPVTRVVSSEVSLWGTVHSNEYHTDFWLGESVLIQIGEKQYEVSRIEIEDPYLFPTKISGKAISECDGEYVRLTGTITSTSEDYDLVKFYTLYDSVLDNDTPKLDNSSHHDSGTSNNSSFDAFINGTWWDLWSRRCNLKMDILDSETVQIEINWSSGAAFNTTWYITGKWDPNTGRLNYENGIMRETGYVEERQQKIILREYTDGTGYFYFEDGYLYWIDDKENAGADCFFEPPIYSTGDNDAQESDINTDTTHAHNFGSWVSATSSLHVRTCSCGKQETEDHTFDDGKVMQEPTTTSTGIKIYSCNKCYATTSETIPILDLPTTQETRSYDYQCICNYCSHNDGVMQLVLTNGIKTDVVWICSACGQENWNYMTLTW